MADPRDRPQKIKSSNLATSRSCSRSREMPCHCGAQISCKPSLTNAIKKGADSGNRPKLFLLPSPTVCPVFSIDLTGDGKLGYGFTSADELEKSTLVLGISHDQHLSARS